MKKTSCDNAMKNIILLNTQYFKVLSDICRTSSKNDFLLKTRWLSEWKNYITKTFPIFGSIPMQWLSKEELLDLVSMNNPAKKWFKRVLIEVCLFTPYFPIGSFNKKLCKSLKLKRNSNNFLDELFASKAYYSVSERLSINKAYNKAFNSVEEVRGANKKYFTFCLPIVILITFASFTIFTTLFGGLNRFSFYFSLLGSAIGVLGGIVIGLVVGIDSLVRNKDVIFEKAKSKTLSLMINK